MGRQRGVAILSVCLLVWLFAAAAVGGDVADVFDPARARAPRPGEWLEFRIAFPVDPLENSLSPDPVPPVAPATPRAQGGGSLGRPAILQPVLDPPEAWRVLPLRLELREITPEGAQARLSYAGESYDIFLPNGPEADETFHYDPPQPEIVRTTAVVNGTVVEVEVTERRGEGYGFIRHFSPDVPFGIVRFATEHVDLALIGTGYGVPPDFPLPDEARIDPPPGKLYR